MTNYIRKCLHCDKEFILKNIAYERRGHGKYCSKQCSKYATKKYSFNNKYFDVIDTSTKAYWLGFLMADGCNTSDELVVEISAKDTDHLYKLKNALEATQKFYQRKRGKYGMISLHLADRQFCKTLTKLGCTPRKSFTLKYPKISNLLERDFIRGVFDGDGCIHIRKDGNKTFDIYSASEKFIMRIKKQIETDTKIKLHKYKQKNGYTIRASKQSDIRSLAIYLYGNRTPEAFMERKRELFDLPT